MSISNEYLELLESEVYNIIYVLVAKDLFNFRRNCKKIFTVRRLADRMKAGEAMRWHEIGVITGQ